MILKYGEKIVPRFEGWENCRVILRRINLRVDTAKVGVVDRATMDELAGRKEVWGAPTHICDIGDKMLRVWPTPDRDYEIVVQASADA